MHLHGTTDDRIGKWVVFGNLHSCQNLNFLNYRDLRNYGSLSQLRKLGSKIATHNNYNI